MLVHARCTQAHYRQTLTSLMYAERARAIRNSVTSHLEGVPDAGEEARRARELEELRCAVDSKTMELQAARAVRLGWCTRNLMDSCQIAMLRVRCFSCFCYEMHACIHNYCPCCRFPAG